MLHYVYNPFYHHDQFSLGYSPLVVPDLQAIKRKEEAKQSKLSESKIVAMQRAKDKGNGISLEDYQTRVLHFIDKLHFDQDVFGSSIST